MESCSLVHRWFHYNNLGSSLCLGWFSMAFLEAIIPKVTDEQQMIDFLNKYKDSFPPELEVVSLSSSGLAIPHENDDSHCIRFYSIYIVFVALSLLEKWSLLTLQ